MKHINLKHWAIIFISSFCWSCKKELNVYPTTSEVDGNIIVDTKSATTLLNGVYYRFANAGPDVNNVLSVKWVDVNEALPSSMANTSNFVDGGSVFFLFKYNSFTSTPAVALMWNYCYALVNAANGFIKNVANVTTIPVATKNEMMAEAEFLRAFGNEQLLLYYGQYYNISSNYGIILRNDFVTSDNINLPRATVAATYAAILSDLDDAIPNLPAKNTETFYANAAAAKILKARVLVNRGTTGDYAEVVTLMNDVIAAGDFTLEPNVKDLFLTVGSASKEVIMNVQPYATENYKFQYYQSYVGSVATDTLVSLLANDPRSQWMYKNFADPFYGVVPEFTKYYSGDVNNILQTPESENCYAFRLTEAYLLEAEALSLLNGDLSAAKTLLITIMSHAGITDFSAVNDANTGAALQLLIVKEEMKNFASENGADWFALRRLPFATVQTLQPSIKTKNQLILPIPNSEITTNNQVVQNPGYTN
jgi:hypothetical protein